jgi:uncharacterized protein (TIGR03437 family)
MLSNNLNATTAVIVVLSGCHGIGCFGQTPALPPDSIVNAASYTSSVAAGSLASLFGANLSPAQEHASGPPYPTELAGVRVIIDGREAPLLFVSPQQINFQVPSQTANRTVPVFVSRAGKSSEVRSVRIDQAAPGVFTQDGAQCGPGAILNTSPGGETSVNRTTGSAAPGDWISIFSTGGGIVHPSFPDGSAAPSDPLARHLLGRSVVLGTGGLTRAGIPFYNGVAPGLVGIDQTVVRLPLDTPEGCNVPLLLGSSFGPSLPVRVSVRTGGGPCLAEGPVRLAALHWKRVVTTGAPPAAGTAVDSFTAEFTEGERGWLSHPAATPQATPQGSYRSVMAPRSGPVCGGLTGPNVEAGDLLLTTIRGVERVSPVQEERGVRRYHRDLSDGFLTPGALTVSAQGNAAIGAFRSEISIPQAIRVLTDLKPGTVINRQQPLRIEWEGGVPGAMVQIEVLSAPNGLWQGMDAFVPAEAGTFTFPLRFLTPAVSELAVPPGSDSIVRIRYFPVSPTEFTAPGLALGGRHQWEYAFEFRGLVIRNPPLP